MAVCLLKVSMQHRKASKLRTLSLKWPHWKIVAVGEPRYSVINIASMSSAMRRKDA